MPRLCDLFCGAGGASQGYAVAGFEVVGVDIHPQPRYPFEFVQADALTFDLSGFDAVHASPPCQHYSVTRHIRPELQDTHPDLIGPTRDMLQASGLPYIIENVEGAPLHDPLMLCGSMFGLCVERGWLQRHRLFECSFTVPQPACDHPEGVRAICVTGGGGYTHRTNGGNMWEWRELMEIDWMTRKEMSQAIPPAYTEYVGHYLMEVVTHGRTTGTACTG